MMTVPGVEKCVSIISKNKTLLKVLLQAAEIIPRQSWYLIGGSVYQTVWNVKLRRSPEANIGDYDLAYFDPHTGKKQQTYYENKISERVPGVRVEVKNQALVTDAWYEREFGCRKDTSTYLSLEDSIAKAYVSSPVIGISWKDGKLQVLELADLDKLLSLEVFPNFKFRGKRVLKFYKRKYRKCHAIWPKVKFYNWDGRLVGSEEDI